MNEFDRRRDVHDVLMLKPPYTYLYLPIYLPISCSKIKPSASFQLDMYSICHTGRFTAIFSFKTWMLRQTPALVTSAAHVGPLRESTRAFSSFVTPVNYGHVIQPPTTSNRRELQQQLPYTHDAHVVKSESDDSVHNWVRLPTMPADTTTHVTYPNTSYIPPDEAAVHELSRALQENEGQTQRNEQGVYYPPESSQEPEIEEEVS